MHVGPQDYRLILTAHEAVADEWSMSVLIEELSAYYAAARDGGLVGFAAAPPPTGFAEFAARQRDRADKAERHGAVDWWLESLLPVRPIRTCRPTGPGRWSPPPAAVGARSPPAPNSAAVSQTSHGPRGPPRSPCC